MLFWIYALLFGLSANADVYSFPDRDLHVTLGIQKQEYSVQLRDDKSSQDLYYKPNIGSVLIPRISYKDLWGLSWGFNTPVSEGDEYLNGKTSFTDVRFDFSFHNFTVSSYYSQYRGMYLANSTAVNPLLTANDPNIQRPDMYSRASGVSFTWVWDPETFSLPNLYNQAERQEKRGGSILFGGAISENVLTADSSFIPASIQNDFDLLASMRGARFQTLSLKGGYGYAFAKKWFIGGAVMVGPGVARRKFEYDNQSESEGWEPTGFGELLLSGGYNGDLFFTSLKIDFRQDFFVLTGSSSQINPQLAAVAFNLGLHLETLNF